LAERESATKVRVQSGIRSGHRTEKWRSGELKQLRGSFERDEEEEDKQDE
jgi:hypothetical protein